jgi:predicted DCC family thiol-disulfide oxidoreductase YuxK
MARRVAAAWKRFWFEPATPTNLGVARCLFFLGLTLFYLPHDFSGWGSVSSALFQPIWLFDRFRIPVFGEDVLRVVQVTWKAALFCSAIGFMTRPSLIVSAILGTYLLALGHNFGQTYHFDAILVLAFWILAFSRAGDAWSIDALRDGARHRDVAGPPPSPEYHWPVQLILVTFSLVFCAAGIAKLRASGLQWIFSDQLAILLDRVQYHISDADPVLPWSSTLARIPGAAMMLAFSTIFFETFYPIALFSRRLRPLFIVGGLGLILGIRAMMGPTFENFLLINLFWVPWDRAGRWIRTQLASRTSIYVFYDGACGVCTSTVPVLRRLDLLNQVELIDVTRQWKSVSAQFPMLTRERCLADMHAVTSDGSVHSGFDAYHALARVLPLGLLARPILQVPAVQRLGRRVYRRVAAHRSRSCEIPIAGARPAHLS